MSQPQQSGQSSSGVFRRFARFASERLGSSWAFIFAVGMVIVWAATGPFFHFSGNWQLVINTSTTIVTFLMVFLLQNTQNRDSLAIHLKLDELLRGTQGTRTGLVNLEQLSDEDLAHLQEEFQRLSEKHGAVLQEELEDVGEELEEREDDQDDDRPLEERIGDELEDERRGEQQRAEDRKAEEHSRSL